MAGLVVPIYNLAAFVSTPLPPSGSPPTSLTLFVPPETLLTFAADGSKSQTGGTYTLYVGGHLPDDEEGTQAGGSNVLQATISLPPAAAPLPYSQRRT